MKFKLLSQKDGVNKYKTIINGRAVLISISLNGELLDISNSKNALEKSSTAKRTIEFG